MYQILLQNQQNSFLEITKLLTQNQRKRMNQLCDSYSNTQKLYRVWDEKYFNRGNGANVFSGDVQEYKYKYIEDSSFIIVKNKSRIHKKINHIQEQSKQVTKKEESQLNRKIIVDRKEQDFHFQKIHPEQIIAYLNNQLQLLQRQQGQEFLIIKQKKDQINLSEPSIQPKEIHSVIINKVPISPYHCLFIPWITGKPIKRQGQHERIILQQKIIIEAIPLVFNLLKSYNDLVIGFNSVGAAASVNNLHFQMFFKQFWIGKQRIPIEALLQGQNTFKRQIMKQNNVNIETFEHKLLQGFKISIDSDPSSKELAMIQRIISRLINDNIPHNLLFLRKANQTQILVFPRRFQREGVRFGCMQYSGVFCLDYESTTKSQIEMKFLEMKLQAQTFSQVVQTLIHEFQQERQQNCGNSNL